MLIVARHGDGAVAKAITILKCMRVFFDRTFAKHRRNEEGGHTSLGALFGFNEEKPIHIIQILIHLKLTPYKYSYKHGEGDPHR